jgi:hypothetical protein
MSPPQLPPVTPEIRRHSPADGGRFRPGEGRHVDQAVLPGRPVSL